VAPTIRAGRAIAYLRCSTDKQAESGLGIDAQLASVTACAARLGIPLAATYTDAGTSGSLSIDDRPVLLDAVADLKRGDVFLIAKRDRIGRDVIAVAMIERLIAKRGARIVSAAGEGTDDDGPSGTLMRRLIDSFGEYERLIIGARTKSALAAKRRRGERVSRHLPYGYTLADDRRTLQPVSCEQDTLAVMRRRRSDGSSFQAIADELNADGRSTRAGSPWRYEYIRSILSRHTPIPE
jgi:DNA invertase Pin-like site-specific DNA recombinase